MCMKGAFGNMICRRGVEGKAWVGIVNLRHLSGL